jgi:lipopolysaccharide/colanic/teichoic acid biosynthesis glycosyltransferase
MLSDILSVQLSVPGPVEVPPEPARAPGGSNPTLTMSAMTTPLATPALPPVAPPAPAPSTPVSTHWYGRWKTVAEFVVALGLFVLFLPVLLLCALLVKLTSSGPVIYSQVRLGRNGRPFRIYKLRTMYKDCERGTGARWSTPGDSRVTRLGRFLRRTHLDELPQLWNVLTGDMSLVGPRPERPEFVPTLEQAIPRYRDRLLVKPGVTGLAQVQLPADTDLDSVRRKLAFDLYYVSHHSLWLDVRLILATGLHMLSVPYRHLRRVFALPGPQAEQ